MTQASTHSDVEHAANCVAIRFRHKWKVLAMKSALAAIATYCVVALIVFGSIVTPVLFLTEWSHRLGIPFWRLIAVGCAALSAAVFLLPKSWLRSASAKLSLFIALSITSSTAAVGIYSDGIKQARIASFEADEVIEHSFFRSIREAPREAQFFVHSAALKNCVAYAWSYRTMSFYRLPPGVVQNVVPNSWLVRCPILRSNHERTEGPLM